MIVIPAIDIIEGKCVRLSQGDFSKINVYNDNPLEVAKRFEEAGISRLHLVDLDGARQGKVRNWDVLKRISSRSTLKIDFSGGINSEEDVSKALDLGAAFISIGSMAVKNEENIYKWVEKFSPEKFIIGADVTKGKIMINGWTEQTSITPVELFNNYSKMGVKHFFCTDIEKDGQLKGPSITLYSKLIEEHPSINLIASGGIRNIRDLFKLRIIGCYGAIIGKAIYENRIHLDDLNQFL